LGIIQVGWVGLSVHTYKFTRPFSKRSLSEYFRRLFQQTWLLVTGGVGFLVSLVAEIFFPNSYVLVVYLAIFIVGIFVGGYFAFVDLLVDYEKLEENISGKQPIKSYQ
jgi:CHASE2 domain-containing sensor protein